MVYMDTGSLRAEPERLAAQAVIVLVAELFFVCPSAAAGIGPLA